MLCLTPPYIPDSGLLDIPCNLIVRDLQMIISEVTPTSLRILPSVRRLEYVLKEHAMNFSVQYICFLHPHSLTMAQGPKGPYLCLLSQTTRILNICTAETRNGYQFDHVVICRTIITPSLYTSFSC